MKIETILFDFDGVILDSLQIKEFGFREMFREFPAEQVERLIQFHRQNGGISRFVKIRYFFETILNRTISDSEVVEYAERFSKIVIGELENSRYLIPETIQFLEKIYRSCNLHIVSGAEENELRYLAKKLGVSKYFITIEGSPTPKGELVRNILERYRYSKEKTGLIGDSINDYQASKENGIRFFGFNNRELQRLKDSEYIESFELISNSSNFCTKSG